MYVIKLRATCCRATSCAGVNAKLPRLHQRNMLRNKQLVACCPQRVDRPRNLPRNMLRWCKWGLTNVDTSSRVIRSYSWNDESLLKGLMNVWRNCGCQGRTTSSAENYTQTLRGPAGLSMPLIICTTILFHWQLTFTSMYVKVSCFKGMIFNVDRLVRIKVRRDLTILSVILDMRSVGDRAVIV